MASIYEKINTMTESKQTPVEAARNITTEMWQKKQFEEVVVSGAVMCCSMAPDDKGDYNEYRRLAIPDDTYFESLGVDYDNSSTYFTSLKLEGNTCGGPGGKMAHEHHCVAEVNINKFSICKKNTRYVKHFEEMSCYLEQKLEKMQVQINAMPENAQKEELAEKRNKLQKDYNRLAEVRFNDQITLQPCVLQLLDRWFDASEAMQISGITIWYQRVLENMKRMREKIRSLPVFFHKKNNSPFIDEEKRKEKEKKIIEIGETIETLNESFNKLDKVLVSFEPNVYQYQRLPEDHIDITIWTLSISACFRYLNSIDIPDLYISNYERLYSLWHDTICPDLGNLWNALKKMPDGFGIHSALTTNSHLVCRMGGYISFINSGQAPLLMENLLPMAVKKAIQHAIDEIEQRQDTDIPTIDFYSAFGLDSGDVLNISDRRMKELNDIKKQEYKDAAVYLRHILNLLELDDDAPAKDIPRNVDVELWLWPHKDALKAAAREKAKRDAILLAIGLLPGAEAINMVLAIGGLIFWAAELLQGGGLPEDTGGVMLDGAIAEYNLDFPEVAFVPGANNANGVLQTAGQNAAWALNQITLIIGVTNVVAGYTYNAADVFNVNFGMTVNTPHHSFTMEAEINQQGVLTMQKFNQKLAYKSAYDEQCSARLKLPKPRKEWEELLKDVEDDKSQIALQYNIDSVNNRAYYNPEGEI